MELWSESRVTKPKCERQVKKFPQSAKLSRAVPVGSVRNDQGTRDAENARPRDRDLIGLASLTLCGLR